MTSGIENDSVEIMVTLSVLCKTQSDVLRAAEVLSRAAAGLSLEQTSVGMNFTHYGGEEEE